MFPNYETKANKNFEPNPLIVEYFYSLILSSLIMLINFWQYQHEFFEFIESHVFSKLCSFEILIIVQFLSAIANIP